MNAFFYFYSLRELNSMRHFLIAFTILVGIQSLNAQDFAINREADSLYREDQIYFGVTYNILGNKINSMSQNGFSGGFHLGVIRDFPINKSRNIALGLGLGLSANSFNQNLKISETNGDFGLEVLNSGDFDKNKFDLYQIELPFEIRWRRSTAEIYKFWRIYSGFKMGYVFASRSKFVGSEESFKVNINDVINKLQYGLTLSIGYDNWNLHLYYALNTVFKDQTLNDNNIPIDLNAIKAGLIFYIL